MKNVDIEIGQRVELRSTCGSLGIGSVGRVAGWIKEPPDPCTLVKVVFGRVEELVFPWQLELKDE